MPEDRIAAPAVKVRARIAAGRPYPLGATWDGLGVNFALFSVNATKVELCLFDRDGRRELERIALPEYTDEVWHGYLADAVPGTVYAYRVHGPYAPEDGHRFNPHKLLIDPYAKAFAGSIRWSDSLFGYRLGSAREDLSFDRRDSAGHMAKCRVIDTAFTWGRDHRPAVPWGETVLYEAHVRGFTMRHPEVPESQRGTYAGFGDPAVIAHLKRLGVTTVEVLPVHAFVDESRLLEHGHRNYWGYNTIGFFAPEPRYSATRRIHEFKEMVARLHDAGIEVILDVVYNHTAEGDERGPTLSFRGIDNASYYRLMPGDRRRYVNDTGTGNTLDFAHPRVVQMATDSLRYWVEEMHVDGFRFDLATVLAREADGFRDDARFLACLRQDPVLSRVKLIAEPWDVGPGGYRLGGFRPGWAEWNDRFRDTVRSFWKGDEGKLADLATRLTASADLFNHRGRKPWASVNFVTSHDGFTLADLVSYNDKHNEANGEENRDGHPANFSWNHGVEGPSDDPEIRNLRRRQQRNLLATLLLSQGTPMLLGGDELARTQRGNNNAYCQDNELSWVDWPGIGAEEEALIEFVRRLIAVRRRFPALRRPRFLTGAVDPATGVKDARWLGPEAEELTTEHWHDPTARALGVLFDGRAGTGTSDALYLVLNANTGPVAFRLPAVPGGEAWRCLVDTGEASGEGQGVFPCGHAYEVLGRTLLLFLLETPAGGVHSGAGEAT